MQLVTDLTLVVAIIDGTLYFTVTPPTETTVNHGVALGTHSREAQLIISRLVLDYMITEEL